MQSPPTPEDKSPRTRNDVRTLVARLDRAAGDLNPVLTVLAVGLLFLNITLYLGLSASHGQLTWTPQRQAGALASPASAAPRYDADLPGGPIPARN